MWYRCLGCLEVLVVKDACGFVVTVSLDGLYNKSILFWCFGYWFQEDSCTIVGL